MAIKETSQILVFYLICLTILFLFFKLLSWLILIILLFLYFRWPLFFCTDGIILFLLLFWILFVAGSWIVSIFSIYFLFAFYRWFTIFERSLLLAFLWFFLILIGKLLCEYSIIFYEQWLNIHFKTILFFNPFFKNLIFCMKKFIYFQI